MQERFQINQQVAMSRGLTLPDALVFAYFWSMRPVDPDGYRWVDHRVWFPVTKDQVAEALPLLNYKPETVRASIGTLVKAGLLDRQRIDGVTHYAVGEAGRTW